MSACAGLFQTCVPALARAMPRRSLVDAAIARTREREHEQRLDGDPDREVAARALQREAGAGVPRRRRDREAREREQAEHHERVVADRPVGRVARDRDEQACERDRRRDDRRRRAVDGPGALGIDGRLAPEPRELAVGLQRRCAAAALQTRLERLFRPGISGASARSPHELHQAGDRVCALIRARRCARSASSAMTSADQVERRTTPRLPDCSRRATPRRRARAAAPGA